MKIKNKNDKQGVLIILVLILLIASIILFMIYVTPKAKTSHVADDKTIKRDFYYRKKEV